MCSFSFLSSCSLAEDPSQGVQWGVLSSFCLVGGAFCALFVFNFRRQICGFPPASQRHAPPRWVHRLSGPLVVKSSLPPARGDSFRRFFAVRWRQLGIRVADLSAGGFGGGACCARAGLRRMAVLPSVVFSIVFFASCVCLFSCF